MILGLLIAGGGLYAFFRNVKLESLWTEMRATHVWVLLLMAALSILTLWFRSLRWRIILQAKTPAQHRGLFSLVMIGFMLNNILPARIGEVARGFLLCKRNGYSISESVGSLVLERFVDSVILGLFFALPVMFIPSLHMLIPYASMLLLGFCGVVLAFFLYSRFPAAMRALAQYFVKFLPLRLQARAKKIGSELITTLDWTFSFRKSIAFIVLSFCTTLCYSAILLVLGRETGAFSILDSLFGASCAALGAAIPLSPGFVGTLHAALLQGLTMVGVQVNRAGAMAILYHAVPYTTVTAVGIYFYFASNISFKEITRAKDELDKRDTIGSPEVRSRDTVKI